MAHYAIIAGWDDQNRVSHYNYVETEDEASAIVDRLRGIGPDALPPAKQAAGAYYVLMPHAPAGCGGSQHRARFWVADPDNSTVSFDAAACHAWQAKVTGRMIDSEADRRIDIVLSPDNPSRAGRVMAEMPEGADKIALIEKVAAVRAAAVALKGSLSEMAADEVQQIDHRADTHWPTGD
jgi:hypothetical protein